MKKIIYSAFLFLGAVTFMTSCQKDSTQIVQESLGARLAQDSDFAKLIETTSGMATSLAGVTLTEEQGIAINDMMRKGNTDHAALKRIIGAGFADFTASFADFSASVNNLEAKYKLSDLNQNELNVAIQTAFDANPALKEHLIATVTLDGKSVGADVCNLVVNIAALLGGGAICTAIGVSTIPVVGGVLCTALLGVAKALLGGICDFIP